MSAVKAAGVLDYMPSVCVYARVCVWPKHIIMQHLLGQRSSNVWPVTHDGAIWLKKNGSGMKWKCLGSQSFSDKRLKNYQVYDWFHRAASNHPITWGHCHILRLSPFPSSRTDSYLSFKCGFRKKSVSCPLCLDSIHSQPYFEFFKQNIAINQVHTRRSPLSHSGVTNSLCLLVWDEISLFHTRQRFITIPSPSPPTPPPRPHTLHTIAIRVSLGWSDLTGRWSTASRLNLRPPRWPQRALSVRAHVRVCAWLYVCQCCGSASHHRAITEEQRAVSLPPHAGQRLQLQQRLHVLHHI